MTKPKYRIERNGKAFQVKDAKGKVYGTFEHQDEAQVLAMELVEDDNWWKGNRE